MSDLQSTVFRGTLIQVRDTYQKPHWWSRRHPVYLRPEFLPQDMIETLAQAVKTFRENYQDPDAPLTITVPKSIVALLKPPDV